MRLSMWIVNDWLEKYEPEARIQEGAQTINGVRYLEDDIQLEKEYLYIGYSEQYIDKSVHNVICVNGNDLILLTARDIYGIFNEIQRMLEFYNNWETRILQAINERKDLDYILSLTTSVLKTSVAISDFSLKVLGHASYAEQEEKQVLVDGYLDPEELRIINRQNQEHFHDHQPYISSTSVDRDIVYNIFSKKDRLICRFISLGGGEGNHVQSRMQLAASFGQLVNLWFMIHAGEFDQTALFLDILEKRETDPGTIAIRMEGLGWYDNPEMQLIVLRSCREDSSAVSLTARMMERRSAGLIVVPYQDDYLLIVNYDLTDRTAFLQELEELMKSQSVCCGCSPVFHQLYELENHYLQACFAAECGSHTAGSVNHCSDYAVEYMQRKFRAAMDTEMTSPVLEKLRIFDQENGTDYYYTLYVYLTCERNQTLAAQKLFIHRNSLIYRVGRIENLIGTDLNDERVRLYLLLSYFLKEDYNISSAAAPKKV